MRENTKYAIFAVIVAVFFIELLRTAWISDDAAITLRTVLNFLHGYGPNFNIDERVQAYTHPLWFLLLSGLSWLINNVFYSAFFLSITLSLAALWLLLTKITTDLWPGVIAAIGLLLSKAFIDFSTSGLENPLAHVLIIFLVLTSTKTIEGKNFSSLVLYFTICSALYLTRPDLLLLALPLTIHVALRNISTPTLLLKAFSLGALPALMWTIFSLYYYGFPFPNTAYAKLGSGISSSELILQGLRYFLDAADRDPITLFIIVIGIAAGFTSSRPNAFLSVGVILYLVYIVCIGGDFMSGRFFTPPLLLAAVLIARQKLVPIQLKALAIGVGVLGFFGIQSTLLSDSSYENTHIENNGIADERGFYYQHKGLLTADSNTFAVPEWRVRERTTIPQYAIGFKGIASGPGTHLIDFLGLADPLLARLPAKFNPNWRVGHYKRQLPTDYEDSIAEGENLLADPSTRSYYDAIRTITRGELNDYHRLREIIRFNSGMVSPPDPALYQSGKIPPSSKIVYAQASQLTNMVDSGPWDATGNTRFPYVVEIDLGTGKEVRKIDISVDQNDLYTVEIFSGREYIIVARIPPTTVPGMKRHHFVLATPTPATDRIRVVAEGGDGRYSLGHLVVE